jgi:hypothetical protein
MPFRVESQAEPIPGYKLIERLGGGGFGEVWKAEAPGGLLKAIKFVYGDLKAEGDDEADGHKAIQELKALSRVKSVRHPYILSLERYDVIDGQLMIVMELADKNLWDRYRECKAQGLPGIPREELLRYMEESAEALDLMNLEYQLQHLDIKPQNIFLVYNHIKVADFGLVKDFQGVVASMTGGVTPVYAAPETFDGLVTRYCDQYSLAIVYQELLTGHRPFTGNNVHQLVMQHVQGVPNLSTLPAAEQPIIGRALSKNPDDRFPSCMEMVRALRAAGGPAVATPVQEVRRAPAGGREVALDETDENPAETITTGLPPLQALLEQAQAVVAAPKPEPPVVLPAPDTASIGKRPELVGDGVLMPSLVIGLGKVGAQVLAKFRAALEETFGAPDLLPNVRVLAIDTDPELTQIPAGGKPPLLPADQVLVTKMHRAIHYLRAREGRPRLDTWLDTTLLGRLPRDQTAGGMRALGRLALIDNYRLVSARLQDDLKACLSPESMKAAAAQTGLTLRTNRPRVYIVAGTGGGTGSGMFLDAAYVVRNHLRRMGFDDADLIGMLLLPPIDRTNDDKTALVNTYAVLTELHHFSSTGATFSARYDDKESNLAETHSPFRCCYVLALPPRTDPEGGDRAVAAAGEFIFRELATPLGREADAHRTSVTTSTQPLRDRFECRSFGLSRFWWPRWALLQAAARQLCRRVTQQWTSKESRTPPERIEQWIQDQWTKHELSFDAQVVRLQAACDKILGQSAEAAFGAIYTGLVGTDKRRPKTPDAAALRDAMAKLEEQVGTASTTSVLSKTGQLEGVLHQETDAMLADWIKKLVPATTRLVEQPEFHLAGAEAAIRGLMELLDKTRRSHESLLREIGGRSRRDFERIQFLLQNLDEVIAGGRRTAQFVTELVELIRVYPRTCY